MISVFRQYDYELVASITIEFLLTIGWLNALRLLPSHWLMMNKMMMTGGSAISFQ
jgi:hypothetical protein